jgi:hypothetical protein
LPVREEDKDEDEGEDEDEVAGEEWTLTTTLRFWRRCS